MFNEAKFYLIQFRYIKTESCFLWYNFVPFWVYCLLPRESSRWLRPIRFIQSQQQRQACVCVCVCV